MLKNMWIKQYNKEVFFSKEDIVKIEQQDIEFLKARANCNQRKRARLCTHKNTEDNLHEMFIAHTKDTYVRPHKHLNKSESFYLIEGLAEVIIFGEEGNIVDIIKMGDYSSGNVFYYRISEPYFHTLFIKSDFLVFHETTKGPFKKSDTIFAPWAPDENDRIAVKKFMKKLAKCIEIKLGRSKRK